MVAEVKFDQRKARRGRANTNFTTGSDGLREGFFTHMNFMMPPSARSRAFYSFVTACGPLKLSLRSQLKYEMMIII
jgi:hypothetical protein